MSMRKVLPTRNPCLRPCFYLEGDRGRDEDGFGGGDKDEKVFAVPHHPIAITTCSCTYRGSDPKLEN